MGLNLKNRFLMAPMTRSHSTEPGDVPNELMSEYYVQRSSACIIVTEATQISLQGKAYARTPGIYTPEQIEGWKKITDAVHAKETPIFLQLLHVGRVSSARVKVFAHWIHPEYRQRLTFLAEDLVDLIGFGRNFLSNPDNPHRLKFGIPLNEISDNHTIFGRGDKRGYTDYPFS